jgi:hypothetical protein
MSVVRGWALDVGAKDFAGLRRVVRFRLVWRNGAEGRENDGARSPNTCWGAGVDGEKGGSGFRVIGGCQHLGGRRS